MLQKPRRFHRVIAQPLPASSYITARNHRYRCDLSSSQPSLFTSDRSAMGRSVTVQAIPRCRPCSPALPEPTSLLPCGSDNTSEGIHHFSFHPARYRPALPRDPVGFKHYVKMPFTSAPFNLHITTPRRKASGTCSSDTSDASDFLNLAQLVERLERRQRIDVDTLDLIPNLHQHGIVELEHR